MSRVLGFGRAIVDRGRESLFRRYAIPVISNERISKRFIANYIPASPIIVECGAHSGNDTVEMARRWPSGVVHAFEPVVPLYDELMRRVSGFPNVRCYSSAVSAHSGSQQMFVSGGSSDGSSSLLAPADHLETHPDVTFGDPTCVTTTTFGDWAACAGVDRVDLFWLDMQGAELLAMRASAELIRSARAVHTEVSTRNTYDGVPLYSEVKEWMESQGFVVAAEAIPPRWDMGNVLFVRFDPST